MNQHILILCSVLGLKLFSGRENRLETINIGRERIKSRSLRDKTRYLSFPNYHRKYSNFGFFNK